SARSSADPALVRDQLRRRPALRRRAARDAMGEDSTGYQLEPRRRFQETARVDRAGTLQGRAASDLQRHIADVPRQRVRGRADRRPARLCAVLRQLLDQAAAGRGADDAAFPGRVPGLQGPHNGARALPAVTDTQKRLRPAAPYWPHPRLLPPPALLTEAHLLGEL